jgi:hypothetical protein
VVWYENIPSGNPANKLLKWSGYLQQFFRQKTHSEPHDDVKAFSGKQKPFGGDNNREPFVCFAASLCRFFTCSKGCQMVPTFSNQKSQLWQIF